MAAEQPQSFFRRVVRAILAVIVVGGTLIITAVLALGFTSSKEPIGDALKLFGALGILSKVVIDNYFAQEN